MQKKFLKYIWLLPDRGALLFSPFLSGNNKLPFILFLWRYFILSLIHASFLRAWITFLLIIKMLHCSKMNQRMPFIAQYHALWTVESCHNHKVSKFKVLMPIYKCSSFQKWNVTMDLRTYFRSGSWNGITYLGRSREQAAWLPCNRSFRALKSGCF